ncbi:MAG: nucleotidyltransferase domain-containing protein [Bacteroidetes bacterium]|nr:nucleotidyltransferase domain-containing protein [Bacteroidota bacterium]
MKLITNNLDQIIALCKKHRVKSLYIFGSILSERFNDQSDIDFVVDFSYIDLLS